MAITIKVESQIGHLSRQKGRVQIFKGPFAHFWVGSIKLNKLWLTNYYTFLSQNRLIKPEVDGNIEIG